MYVLSYCFLAPRYILVISKLACDSCVSFDAGTGTCNSIEIALLLLIVVEWPLVLSLTISAVGEFSDALLFLTNNLAMSFKSRPFVSGTIITTKTAAIAQNAEYIQNVPAVVINCKIERIDSNLRII